MSLFLCTQFYFRKELTCNPNATRDNEASMISPAHVVAKISRSNLSSVFFLSRAWLDFIFVAVWMHQARKEKKRSRGSVRIGVSAANDRCKISGVRLRCFLIAGGVSCVCWNRINLNWNWFCKRTYDWSTFRSLTEFFEVWMHFGRIHKTASSGII